MPQPIYVRELSATEKTSLKAGLRSGSGFSVRRRQIVLASRAGKKAGVIAAELQCDDQTVRNAIKAFNHAELASLQAQSRAAHHKPHQGFAEAGVAALKVLIRRSPRQYGKATSIWTLALLAEVCFAEKVTARLVSSESVRLTWRRAGIAWKRAKRWIVSPDPDYDAKKNAVTA